MVWGFENGITILLLVIGFIVILYAQSKVTGSYNKYKKIILQNKLSGFEIARKILDNNGLNDIHIVETKGNLTDHCDPSRKVLRLSREVFNGETIAAASIATHEAGHAIQHKENYGPMKLRSFLVPIVNFVTYMGYFVLVFSIFIGISGYFTVGIFMLLAVLVFELVTLPVEFNASEKAKHELVRLNIVTPEESNGSSQMLKAAALTYVASLISTLLSLLRLIIMASDRD